MTDGSTIRFLTVTFVPQRAAEEMSADLSEKTNGGITAKMFKVEIRFYFFFSPSTRYEDILNPGIM